MKKILAIILFSLCLFKVQAQCPNCTNSCKNEQIVVNADPYTPIDAEPTFTYVNDKWWDAPLDLLDSSKISASTVKNDEYGNRAIFLTYPKAESDSIYKEFYSLRWGVYHQPNVYFNGDTKPYALRDYLNANIHMPEGFKDSVRVIVKFNIHPDGSISDIKLTRPSKYEEINNDAIRVVEGFPKFKVVYNTPKKHSFAYTIPIRYDAPGTIHIR